MPRLWLIIVVGSVLLSACRSDRSARQPRACTAPAKQESATHQHGRYAVLVNGDSEARHRENIAMAFQTLHTLGFEEQHIYVVSPPDHRRLPKAAVRLAPVPDNFWQVMDDLADSAVPGDLVLVYGTGHGDTAEGESILELRRGEVWASDLRDEIDHLRADNILIMDQCRSGGFTDAIQGTKGRVIVITTVDKTHDTDCYYFARAFWNAFLHPEQADRNKDGKTSVREAFDVAIQAHHKALADDPELASDGSFRSFNGLEDATLN